MRYRRAKRMNAKSVTAVFLTAAASVSLFMWAGLGANNAGAVDTATNPRQEESATASAEGENLSTSESWQLLLVNNENPLPDNFSVKLSELDNGEKVDSRVCGYLNDMLSDMKAAGLSPVVCSAYRSEREQTANYQDSLKERLDAGMSREEAEAETAKYVALPGCSEHETGMAVDIVAESNQMLINSQEDTAEQQWLFEHCAEYGFILRYPSDKVDITGIGYEPWHYRFVGVEDATAIMKSGLCLEEYLQGK